MRNETFENGSVFKVYFKFALPGFQCSGRSSQGLVFAFVIAAASKLFGYTGILFSRAVSDLITAVLAVVLFRISLYSELK